MTTHTTSKRKTFRTQHGSQADLPASRVARDRGTVLLMVVAVLALLSIIAVVYTTIGRADRYTSAALTHQTSVEDQAQAVVDYLNKVISDDVLAVGVQQLGSQNIIVREGSDYPSDDPRIRIGADVASQKFLEQNEPAFVFNAVGTHMYPRSTGGVDNRRMCDPWLASTAPTWLPFDDKAPASAERLYMDRVDWEHISNPSPDGLPVNLSFLRNNYDVAVGRAGISSQIFQMKRQAAAIFGDPKAVGTRADVDTKSAVGGNYIFPVDWTTNQEGLFRPAVDSRSGITPADPKYLLNNWADADGDSFLDSTWTELTDTRDPYNVGHVFPGDGGRTRYFAAVRIIDLSGLINVNTACDLSHPATLRQTSPSTATRYMVGENPAYVDLLGMLKMQWAYDEYGRQPAGEAYNQISLQGMTGPDDYGKYTRDPAKMLGESAYIGARFLRETSGVPDPLTTAYADGVVTNFPGSVAEMYYAVSARKIMGVPFGLGDEIELRGRGGVNDPANRTPLEAVTGELLVNDNALKGFSPLRDNRSLAAETIGRDTDPTLNPSAAEYRKALLTYHTDVRKYLTTLSKSRRIPSAVLGTGNPGSLTQYATNVAPFFGAYSTTVTGGAPADEKDKLNKMLSFYADALMPFVWSGFAPNPATFWDKSNSDYDKYAPLSYAGKAELAYRVAMHNVLNLRDSAFDDDEPTRVVLNVRPQNGTANAADIDYPWTQVQLDDTRLIPVADINKLQGSHRVNLFGVKPQPFLVEAARFTFYVDTPENKGGDDDVKDADGDGNPDDPDAPITINKSRDPGNHDYIGEIIAFQVNNPFDVAIKLSGDTLDKDMYYIEYDGHIFQLTELDDAGVRVATTIDARKTRVFYAISTTPDNFKTRLAYSEGLDVTTPAVKDFFKNWADHQFGTNATRIPVLTSNPTGTSERTFNGTVETGDTDVFPNASAQTRDSVYLWRVQQSAITGDEAGNPNKQSNDLLIDRLRSPVADGFKLDQLGDTGDEPVDGTHANDNTGVAVVQWASIFRPTKPASWSWQNMHGVLPPWCVEAKVSTDINTTTAYTALGRNGSLNDSDKKNVPLGSDQTNGWYTTVSALLASTASIDDKINQPAEDRTGSAIPDTMSKGSDAVNLTFEKQQIQTFFNHGTDTPGLYRRSGDLFLPLGIGPSFDPLADDNSNNQLLDPLKREAKWTTLSEAIALAMDYYSPSNPNDLFFHFGHEDLSAANAPRAALDRGHLALDRFIPFYDADMNGKFDLAASPDDRRVGLGVPLALGVLDQMYIWRPADRAGTALSSDGVFSGLININTAPLDVLRRLPLLSPTSDLAEWNLFWQTGTTSTGLPRAEHDSHADIAAIVTAYRDKNRVSPWEFPGDMTHWLDFRDASRHTATDPFPFPMIEPEKADGRYANVSEFVPGASGDIGPAGREDTGFMSIGELYFGSRDIANGLMAGTLKYAYSIDRFGVDGVSTNQPGIDSYNANDNGSTAINQLTDDGVVDGYDEKLQIANAVLNCVNIRSDTFCVWFVLHGYTREDVTDLADTDPMVPSVARRYMMIVDRSNVQSNGDKGRVLLFQELPN